MPVLPPSTLWLAEPGSQHWEGREEGGGKTLKPGPTFPKEGLGRVADGECLPHSQHGLTGQGCTYLAKTVRVFPVLRGHLLHTRAEGLRGLFLQMPAPRTNRQSPWKGWEGGGRAG